MATLPHTQTLADISLQVTSPLIRTEKRITPSWTVGHLKGRLETVTGIPPGSMRLVLHAPGKGEIEMDGDEQQVGQWITGLGPGMGEIKVHDLRPPEQRNLDLIDTSNVEKYRMSDAAYEERADSVLAWKKTQKLGRFDPAAPEHARQKIAAMEAEVANRGIAVGKRCQLGDDSSRRGVVRYVGEIPEVPGPAGPWVGVELDEPVGKNDGSAGEKRYFECPEAHGVFVRPERVLIGDYGVLLEEEDMEEI